LYSWEDKSVTHFWTGPIWSYHSVITNYSIWLHIVLVGRIFLHFCPYTIQLNSLATWFTKKIPAFENICPPYINPKSKEYFGHLQICKTPGWAVAHYLEWLSMNGKGYCLYPCDVAELGHAADYAYLIVGYLNKGKCYIEKNANNKSGSWSKVELYFEWWHRQDVKFKAQFIDMYFICAFNFTILLSPNSGKMPIDTSFYDSKSWNIECKIVTIAATAISWFTNNQVRVHQVKVAC